MKSKSAEAIIVIISLTICAAALSAVHYQLSHKEEVQVEEKPWTIVRCVLDMSDVQKKDARLITGYSYFLLESFLKSQGWTPEIRLKSRGTAPLDSLRSGSLEILCIPAGREAEFHGLTVSSPVDDNCRWVMNPDDASKMAAAEEWIARYNNSPKRDSINRRFLNVRRTKEYISPYDSLLKASAKRNHLDWRLLAAVIYHESRFHIEAVSKAGALGLSQLIPSTASKYGAEDALNPEYNIEGGAKYLRYLIGLYSRMEGQEKLNFALAAYNGGPGSILEYKGFADSIGLDRNSWADVQEAILTMYADTLDSPDDSTGTKPPVQTHWLETANYVSSVMSVYIMYRNNYPAQ